MFFLVPKKIFGEKVAKGNGLIDTFGHLVQNGMIDLVLMTRSALTHGASVSSMLITIAAMITDKPQLKSNTASLMNGFGGMGGMDMM